MKCCTGKNKSHLFLKMGFTAASVPSLLFIVVQSLNLSSYIKLEQDFLSTSQMLKWSNKRCMCRCFEYGKILKKINWWFHCIHNSSLTECLKEMLMSHPGACSWNHQARCVKKSSIAPGWPRWRKGGFSKKHFKVSVNSIHSRVILLFPIESRF